MAKILNTPFETMDNYIAENASTHFILETITRIGNEKHVIACAIPMNEFRYTCIKPEKDGRIKYRYNTKDSKFYQRIADFTIDCGTLETFNAECKAYKAMLKKSKGKDSKEYRMYNRGWHLERMICKHYHRRWTRFDNTPHGQAGDFELNGIKYQVKANEGEF